MTDWIIDRDTQLYRYACLYMGLTEIFDRSLTNLRSPWDTTEAYIDGGNKRASNAYAITLRNKIRDMQGISGLALIDEINRYPQYTAQMWVDEYYRLWREKL